MPRVRRPRLIFIAFLTVVAASCGGSPASNQVASEPPKPPAPEIPADVQQVAQSALGSDAEVVVFGDLARTGTQQVLAVLRFKNPPEGTTGLRITRAVIVEKQVKGWTEVLRCDEHLKNPQGFLGGAPIAPVNGWRLQYEQHEDNGLALYFTPLQKPVGGYLSTIGVRWNPQVKRYQSLDRSYQQFLGEIPPLEMPQVRLKG